MYLIPKGRGQAPCWEGLPVGESPCGSWVKDTLVPADRHSSYWTLWIRDAFGSHSSG